MVEQNPWADALRTTESSWSSFAVGSYPALWSLFLLYVDVDTHTVHFPFILHTCTPTHQNNKYCMFTLGCSTCLAVKMWFPGLFHCIDATYLALTTDVFASRIDRVSSPGFLRRTWWQSGVFFYSTPSPYSLLSVFQFDIGCTSCLQPALLSMPFSLLAQVQKDDDTSKAVMDSNPEE